MNAKPTPKWYETLSDFKPFIKKRSGMNDWEDLFQNTALKILTTETESDVPKDYVFHKIQQCAVDADRYRKRRIMFSAITSEPFRDDKSESQNHACEYLALLTNEQQRVLRMHWMQKYTWPEIASIIGKEVEAVKSQGKQALGKLRAYAHQEDYE